MAFYKITDQEIIAKVTEYRDLRISILDKMRQLATKYGFESACYADHRELGLWLAGFVIKDTKELDNSKWKWFVRKDGYFQVSPKKSNRKFYKELKDEYEYLVDTPFRYDEQLKLLDKVNWLAVKDIYFADDAIFFETDFLLSNTHDYVQEILSSEFNKAKINIT